MVMLTFDNRFELIQIFNDINEILEEAKKEGEKMYDKSEGSK